MWNVDFKQRREEYGAKQADVAKLAGIHVKTLSAIENGKKGCSDDLKRKLDISLEKLNPKYKLYAIFDYCRVRFPTHNYLEIIERVLQLKFEFFIDEGKGFYGYKKQFVFSDISVLISDEEDERGTLLELKGKGCRRLEYLLIAQGRTWTDFFLACLSENGVFKRLDIAINDTAGILDIADLGRRAGTDDCQSLFAKVERMSSTETKRSEVVDEKYGEGLTLYLGSMKSEIYFCIYEKDYEQYIKNGIPIEDADVKNRFEIRLKDQRAYVAIMEYITNEDIEEIAFGIINRYVCFYDEKDKSKDISEWKIEERWAWFMGNGRDKLKLTMQPEPYDIEKTRRWVVNQVAPSLSLLNKIDNFDGTHIVEDCKNVKLPDKQKRLFEQYTTSVYDVITTNDYVSDKSEILLNSDEKGEKRICADLEKKYSETLRKLQRREEEIALLIQKLKLGNFEDLT